MTIVRPTPIAKIGVNAGIAMISRDLGEPAIIRDHSISETCLSSPWFFREANTGGRRESEGASEKGNRPSTEPGVPGNPRLEQ